MIDFNLYDDVIIDFSTDQQFIRLTTIINNIGREEKTALPSITEFCYPHPATDADLIEVQREGYHVEDMIKIFARVNANIKADDLIIYSGLEYRVMKTNIKLVDDYSKFLAELTDQNQIPDIPSEDFVDEFQSPWVDELGKQWVS